MLNINLTTIGMTNPTNNPMSNPNLVHNNIRMRMGDFLMYHQGTDYVSETGLAILEKGEAVILKEKNMHDAVKDVLGGHSAHKPKKELHEVRTRKVKGHGGKTSYIHEHHFTHPEHHIPEEHASANQDEMVSHMMDHMGEPNLGEAEADQGQASLLDSSSNPSMALGI